MTTEALSRAFAEWTRAGQALVLASVFATKGSTYSKTGAQMLITNDGKFQGMLSGGCLEGDLAERAKAVAENGVPQTVTYDLGREDDTLWGLGVGCDGLIQVFLQRLTQNNRYQPFHGMRSAYEGVSPQVSATVIGSKSAELAVGSTLILRDGVISWSDVGKAYQPAISEAAAAALKDNRSQNTSVVIARQSVDLLLNILRPYPRILVLGAGLDAVPVVRFIAELGWRAIVCDHRPAAIDNGDFSAAHEVHCAGASDLSSTFELDHYDAAIVMSHHLVTDETYLRQLADSQIPYVGLLGPRHRRDRLLKSLGIAAAALSERLHGPAGIDIHASGPASIALSIVAQIHQQIVLRR